MPDPRDKGELILEVAALLTRLPDDTITRLRQRLATTEGRDEFVELLRWIYRLDDSERAGLLVALREDRRFRIQA